MGSIGLGLNEPQQPLASLPETPHEFAVRKVQAQAASKGGAGWFIWIAGLSIVNTISALSGSRWGFAAGLGTTQIVDAVAARLGAAGAVLGLGINVIAVAFFVLLWAFARKAEKWPFIVGLVCYGLDTVLTLVIGLWLSLIIHGLALFGMVRGLKACSELKAIAEQELRARAGAVAAPIA